MLLIFLGSTEVIPKEQFSKYALGTNYRLWGEGGTHGDAHGTFNMSHILVIKLNNIKVNSGQYAVVACMECFPLT